MTYEDNITYTLKIALAILTAIFLTFSGCKKYVKIRFINDQNREETPVDTRRKSKLRHSKISTKLSFDEIASRIPELEDVSITNMYLFVRTVDELMFSAVHSGEDQVELTLSIVKRKIKGSLVNLIACSPDWRTVREMLIISLNVDTEIKLRAKLSGAYQNNGKLESYYEKIVEALLSLIIRSTKNASSKRERNLIELELRNLAKERFINGLESNLHSPVITGKPDTLEAAYGLAMARQRLVGKDIKFNMKTLEKEMIQIIEDTFEQMKSEKTLQSSKYASYNENEQNRGRNEKPVGDRNAPFRRFCRYHKGNKSHSTNECAALKRKNNRQKDKKRGNELLDEKNLFSHTNPNQTYNTNRPTGQALENSGKQTIIQNNKNLQSSIPIATSYELRNNFQPYESYFSHFHNSQHYGPQFSMNPFQGQSVSF